MLRREGRARVARVRSGVGRGWGQAHKFKALESEADWGVFVEGRYLYGSPRCSLELELGLE